jgi:flagellar L-ring protein precursor FlgH
MEKFKKSGAWMGVLLALPLGGLTELHAESLWQKAGSGRSMYASRIAWRVGDLLTVTVSENIDYNSTQSVDVGSKNSPLVDLGGILLDSLDVKELQGKSVQLSDLLNGKYFTTPSAVDGSTQILASQIPVSVVDVLPNQNLVVEGMRHLSFGGESRYMVLQGVVRPLDIDVTTNTVTSNRIANARIEFIADGAVGEVQRKGWLTRFVDKINPF